MTAVRPSRTSSPVIVPLKLFRYPFACAYAPIVRVRAARNPVRWEPALAGVDVVREREDVLLVAVVVLEGDLDLDVAPAALEVLHLRVHRRLVLVDVLDELADAPRVVERDLLLVPLVLQLDLEPLVEERELPEPVREDVEAERRDLEDLRVRLEPDRRPALRRLLAGLEVALGLAAVVALRVEAPVAANLDLEPFGERVDDRHPDAVEAAGDLVHGALELPARVEGREHDLRGGLAGARVHVDRDAAPVVDDRAAPIRVEDRADVRAVPRQRLVDRVVDDLEDQVVEAVAGRVADVHRRPLADGLEPLEDLDVARGVRLGGARPGRRPGLRSAHAAPRVKTLLGSRRPSATCQTAPLPVAAGWASVAV